jgi:hypothetical protein
MIRLVCALFIAAPVLNLGALEFRLQGNRITLQAEQAPLREIMQRFSQAGIRVRMDPALNAQVTSLVTNAPLENTLQELLSPYGYALLWDVIKGPLGDLPRLAEIQVFRRGHRQDMVPLFDPGANLDVTTGPDVNGPLFVKDEILLAVKPGTSLEEFQSLVSQIGGTVIECLPELGIYRIRFMPGTNIPALVDQLTGHPVVHTAEPNYAVKAPTPQRMFFDGPELPDTPAWPAPSANSTAVAVLDSGLGQLPGLEELIVGRYDALDPDRPLQDTLGHGTQMALIASGAVMPGGGSETAPGIPLVAIRAFDDNGTASNFSIMRSIAYAREAGSRVINMSWGSETSSEFLRNAIAYAQSQDMVVVASAGNEPTGNPMYPAAYPGVLAVSATHPDGALWEQSNYGDFVSLSAPGTASFPVGYQGPPGAYAGTSISSAFTAHALAAYFSLHPEATVQTAIQALETALTDVGEEGRDPMYGNGILDREAMARLLQQ